jgi:hypothetical protein
MRSVSLADGSSLDADLLKDSDKVFCDNLPLVLTSVGRLVVSNGRIVGTRGAHKVCFKNEDHALCLFLNVSFGTVSTKDTVSLHYEIAQLLYEKGLHPPVEWYETNLKISMKHSESMQAVKLKAKVYGYKTDYIHYPDYTFYDVSQKDLFLKLWSNKRIKPIHLSEDESKLLFGRYIHDDHPDFCLDVFENFCDRIRQIFKENSLIRSARKKPNPDVKWSNVLYCTQQKKWFWVDFG